MRVEDLTKFEGECPNIVVFGTYFDNGASNSMFWETFEKLDLDTGDATWLHQSYCCDHCVNHWGIDLCECESGARVGECECGSQKAHDTLGIKYGSFGAILKNFG